jgi:hypothetical protein
MGLETLNQQQAANQPSFSDRVSELILQSCRSKDANARISTILRDNCGRTVVRVRTGESSDAVSLLKALKDLWPLAKTAVVENQLDGSVEAQIVVPREEDERTYARQRAMSSRCAEFLHAAVIVLLLVGLVLYINDVYLIHEVDSTKNATSEEAHAFAADDREL